MADKKELLLFQLGPVQEFIAQARSTRDLWSGSYMLSWLMAHAICEVMAKGGLSEADVQMPSLANNPLVTALRDDMELLDLDKVLIPNLPNRALLAVPAERGKELAKVAQTAVLAELKAMGDAVWKHLAQAYGADGGWKTRWDAQLAAFPQFTWAVTAWDGTAETWQSAYKTVNQNLAARRNTRDFAQWNPGNGSLVKDSLSGKEETIGDDAFWNNLRGNALFNKAKNHRYGAVNLIKRLWIRVGTEDDRLTSGFFADALNFRRRQVRGELRVTSLPDIAKGNFETKSPYVAVLAFDGDKMGETVKQHAKDPEGLRKVSQTLSTFALDRVRGIVEDHAGFLVYAGGDDVLALLPASRAIACARSVREAFRKCGDQAGYKLDGSCGIAVGHFSAPLQMLVKEAQRMEHVAKEKYNRGALAVALYKRSGEIIEWGTRWDDGHALDLLERVADLSRRDKIPGRFPYALAALLSPYEFGKSKWKDGEPDREHSNTTLKLDEVKSLIRSEFEHVLGRQGRNLSTAEQQELTLDVEAYLNELTTWRAKTETSGEKKPHPEDFVKLFLVETFINRERGEEI